MRRNLVDDCIRKRALDGERPSSAKRRRPQRVKRGRQANRKTAQERGRPIAIARRKLGRLRGKHGDIGLAPAGCGVAESAEAKRHHHPGRRVQEWRSSRWRTQRSGGSPGVWVATNESSTGEALKWPSEVGQRSRQGDADKVRVFRVGVDRRHRGQRFDERVHARRGDRRPRQDDVGSERSRP